MPTDLELTDDEREESPEIQVGEASANVRALLEPVVTRVVDALGGYEGSKYRMGDEVVGCLKDLKKLWRRDDDDDDRTVARIFWDTQVLPSDLIPILLATAGQGLVEDKRAILCADLITAMTWPIDMAEELKELDEELDRKADYTLLHESHLHYKAALLKTGVMKALFGIVLPPLSKSPRERKERDGQIVNVVLHLIRNLAFIKDLPSNSHLSSEQAEFSSLQSKLIRVLSETRALQLLLTIAANAENDPLFNSWNTLILEIFCLLFRGVTPGSLSKDQTKQPAENLHRLLAAETKTRQVMARKVNSRHSRFGTTIAVTLNPNKKLPPPEVQVAGDGTNTPIGGTNNTDTSSSGPSLGSRSFVLHRQQAISSETGDILDISKRTRKQKGIVVDPLAREDNLSVEARATLQNLAMEFVEACFNPFLSALLKDIRSERIKITEKDNLRLLYVTKWFLEFFLAMRANERAGADKNAREPNAAQKWDFGLVAEVTERSWIIWILKRMREAVEEKPKLWTELQAGIQCLTQLLLLIEAMSSSDISDPELREAADTLKQQLIYNGEVLDIAIESLRSYKEGTQSLAYLDCSVYLAYALLRMLEKWSKGQGDGVYVRQKKVKKKAKKKLTDTQEGIPEEEEEGEEEEEEEEIHETIFTFEAFEMKFANSEVTHTLLTYLARYKEFNSSENIRRVVSLMHRQAVKAKAEGLFFQVSTLDLFKTLLADQASFPREQPYKDLVKLIQYILRQFFKALGENPFLAVEVFFPKNRSHWKQFSSWEPEPKASRGRGGIGYVNDDTADGARKDKMPKEVHVKKGYSWSDQLGIAITSLAELNQLDLVVWATDILRTVIDQRKLVIEASEAERLEQGDDEVAAALDLQNPSAKTMAKIQDYVIPYLDDNQANAATKNAHLKLLFRLCKFNVQDESLEELQWFIPSSVLPSDLQSTFNVINQFMETPFDLQGKKVSQYLAKKASGAPRKSRRRRRHSASPLASDAGSLVDDGGGSDDGEGASRKRGKRKEKKKKEKQVYKSAQFIEDSDEGYGNLEEFLEKEKALRARMGKLSEKGRIDTMKAHGTKKRKKKNQEALKKDENDSEVEVDSDLNDAEEMGGGKRKKHKPDPMLVDSDQEKSSADEDGGGAGPAASKASTLARPKPRPKPRPRMRKQNPASSASSPAPEEVHDVPNSSLPPTSKASEAVASDDDDGVAFPSTAGRRRKTQILVSDDEE